MSLQAYRVSRHSMTPVSSEVAILIVDGVNEFIVYKRADVEAEITERCKSMQAMADSLLEHEHSFNLRWKADMRAIKRWQAATGRDMTWPDHADLVVWLLEQLEAAQQAPKP